MDYVKMHGALYDRTVRDTEHAAAGVIHRGDDEPGLPVLGFPGSALLETAREAGHPVVGEAYPGPRLLPDGTLVPRTKDGALLVAPGQIAGRAGGLASKGEIEAVDGTVIRVRPAVPEAEHPRIRGHGRRRAASHWRTPGWRLEDRGLTSQPGRGGRPAWCALAEQQGVPA